MDTYDFLSKVTNWALWLLGISFGLAVIDNIYFDEAYRSTIGIVGIIALCAFFIGIISAVIKGATDKDRSSGDN